MQTYSNNENLDIWVNADKYFKRGKRFAIATVISTWGSSPRPVGSQMLVTSDNEIIGSVSGGCIEHSVIHESIGIINGALPKVLHFGVGDEKAWEVGLTCGGKISVYVEDDKSIVNLLKKMISAIKNREEFTILKNIKSHENFLYFQANNKICGVNKNNFVKDFRFQDIEKGISKDKQWFVTSYLPETKIVIVGAVHITQYLANLCNICGFSVDIIDPRETFATKKRFKIGKLINQWPDEYFQENTIDTNTAIVTLTHDPKLDDPAIYNALNSSAFYIGCLGSRKTHSSRINRLKKKGFTKKEIERINGPVGLDIFAKRPSEIAISIIAQIIQLKNNL